MYDTIYENQYAINAAYQSVHYYLNSLQDQCQCQSVYFTQGLHTNAFFIFMAQKLRLLNSGLLGDLITLRTDDSSIVNRDIRDLMPLKNEGIGIFAISRGRPAVLAHTPVSTHIWNTHTDH